MRIAVLAAFLFVVAASGVGPKDVEAARAKLKGEGLKTDLAEFNLFTTAEARRREGAITNLFGNPRDPDSAGAALQPLSAMLSFAPRTVGAVAVVPWQHPKLLGQQAEEMIPGAREVFGELEGEFDAAVHAILEGPITFHLDASRGYHMLLPHVSRVKLLAQLLMTRMALDLQEGKSGAAFTNLLAMTRLSTAWQPEPVEVSHLVRFAVAGIGVDATWQALQTNCWSDEQLARLQAEWAGADFLKGLPEQVAFTRASLVGLVISARTNVIPLMTMSPRDAVRDPRGALGAVQYQREQRKYRDEGTYEDERDILMFYRDREVEMRRAIRAGSWAEMRQMRGVTNAPFFESKHQSPIAMQLSVRKMQFRLTAGNVGTIGKAAVAEAQRRLVMTAIAVERHRLKHGSWPKSLEEGMVDFMDGKPLRYRIEEGRFVLYSVGLDCADDGGKALNREAVRRRGNPFPEDAVPGSDLVWPRAATEAELAKMYAAEDAARAERLAREKEFREKNFVVEEEDEEEP